mgnify:CR=1 FL=1|jgi:Tfp pilus assembly protein PilP
MAGTPENVARIATEKAALDLDGLALLGTMVEPAGPRALVRTAGGSIQKVAPGDRIGLVQIQAIGAGMVQIASLGAVHTLTMPK